MRHLYSSASEPGVSPLIDKAKCFERRRCDHRPEEYPEPLSTLECLSSVVDLKGSKTNKHRYVVASQVLDVRKAMRVISGVPLIYINRSVMIMEPMAGVTAENREREERSKFRAGLKSRRASGTQGIKRKREYESGVSQANDYIGVGDGTTKKRSHGKGPKGPNPLSVKKPKKRVEKDASPSKSRPKGDNGMATEDSAGIEASFKRKRRRKHKPNSNDRVVVDGRDSSLDASE
jgi:U3 small nucleolar RNA-associated protein 23